MFLKQLVLILLSSCSVLSVCAQYLSPVTRFHTEDSPYRPYSDDFLSGFVQSADNRNSNGFLQMPFVGDPLLIYVGEKDSTQYMAYASGYEFKQRASQAGNYVVDLTRYGISAKLEAHPAYTWQEYTFPDTLADKGFLIDIDHAMVGEAKEDMDVKLIDKYTLRASKRSADTKAQIFYYAHFSHPFSTWNIRRERVKLENGTKEARCKVALTFVLQPDEKLIVASAVSKVGEETACAQLEGHAPVRHKESNPTNSSRIVYHFDKSSKESTAHYVPKTRTKTETVTPKRKVQVDHKVETPKREESYSAEFIDLITREADFRAAFFSAWSILQHQPECRGIYGVDEFFKAITPLYWQANEPEADEGRTDTLLRQYAHSLFSGIRSQNKIAEAAWYVFNALGFRPSADGENFRMVRPLFNVATFQLSNGRRLMMYTKNNGPKNIYVERISMMHKPLIGVKSISLEQLLRGGTMEVKMTRVRPD